MIYNGFNLLLFISLAVCTQTLHTMQTKYDRVAIYDIRIKYRMPFMSYDAIKGLSVLAMSGDRLAIHHRNHLHQFAERSFQL